jgi:hypothetical protein
MFVPIHYRDGLAAKPLDGCTLKTQKDPGHERPRSVYRMTGAKRVRFFTRALTL